MACVTRRRGKLVMDFRDNAGRRRVVVLPRGMTRKEGKIELGKILKKLEQNSFRPNREIPHFNKLAEEWLNLKRIDLRRGSYRQYKGHIDNHLVPYMGKLKADSITYPIIEGFKAHCRERGVSVPTIAKILTTLGTILTYAVRCRYCDSNPVRDVEKPRKTREDHIEIRPFSPSEIRDILANTPNNKYRMMFLFAALTGLRQGEIFALRWSDIDWQQSQVQVRRTFNHGEFYSPKSAASSRKVDISPTLRRQLKEWRIASEYSKDSDLVFPSSAGTPLSPANVTSRHFKPALQRAGIEYRKFHTFRHTFASLLLEQGENIRYISGQLGHSSTSLTLDTYSHLISNTNQDAAVRLSERVLGDSH
jgi:integrase